MRNAVKKSELKVGDLLTSSYGCTMNRVQYYQVVRIEKSKVVLGQPRTDFEATGYDAGYAILLGPSDNPGETQLAKATSRGLKKASLQENGKLTVGNHRWDYLYKVEAGYREYTYGD